VIARIVLAGFVLLWIFGPSVLRSTVPIWVVFLVAIGVVKFLQIRAAMAQGASFSQPPTTVTSLVAKEEEWPATLTAIGSVEAVNGVLVSADLADMALFEEVEVVSWLA